MVILHGSDLQVGRPFLPDRAEAFLGLARGLAPDLVVVSGDLTQRAKSGEYRMARELLTALQPLPVVVTPGNHDVPLYRVWERAVVPYRNWRRFISADLDSVTRLDGATVVALNSSAPRRAVVGGRLDRRQLSLARRAFVDVGESDHRILVVHHHWVPTPDRSGGRPLPGAASLLRELETMGVDLVLGGHVHQTHLSTSRALVPGEEPGVPLVACGTTTSSRGRGPEAGANTSNVIRVEGSGVEIRPHRFDSRTRRFEPVGALTFPLPGRRASPTVGGAP
jgi:3',5'-cyclic AMP phosphodiesterase CpdA